MKNIETPDKINLGRLINQLREGRFVIPDFQRDFIWTPADVKELLKSIFEDYYIGTLLLWKASKKNQEDLSCKPIDGFKEVPDKKVSAEHIVLDGQQRLSALFYAFFAPDKCYKNRKTRCLFVINIDSLINEDYDNAIEYEWLSKRVKKILKDRKNQFKESILPLSILGKEGDWSLFKWLTEYEDYWSEKIERKAAKEKVKKVREIFNELINEYDISYIELDRDIKVSKVCDIFTRINNTGVNLNMFDLLNALLRPKKIKLKEMWRKAEEELGEFKWRKTNLQLLQTISILKQNYCSSKYLYYLVPKTLRKIKEDERLREIEIISSKEEFIEEWNFVLENIKKTIDKLKNPRDFGAIKPNLVPYPTMMPILTSLYIEKDKDCYSNKENLENKIKKWYWASIFTQNYSSSVESQMARDFQEMKKWFEEDKLVPGPVKQIEREIENIDLEKETRSGSSIYKAIFNILITKKAKDWNTFELPEYSKLEDHHIVPRSWGKRNGLNNKIDTILNRVLISEKTNRIIISDKLPNIYLKKMLKMNGDKKFYELLESHLISRKAANILMRNNFSKKDYEEFIEERKKTIIEEIKKMLGLDIKYKIRKDIISPEKPYSNKIQMIDTIKDCNNFIYWIDKYFSEAGLEMINLAFQSENKPEVEKIKILTSLEKVNIDLRKIFKRFKEEFKDKSVEVEMRVIINNKLRSKIHDRWILSENKCFNVPSPDVIARGQYSEIKETKNVIPFKKWWEESLDVISQWNKIEKLKNK